MPEAIRQGDIPGVQLRRRAVLARPREAVWGCLTSPDQLARWACAAARMPAGAGGEFEWRGAVELGVDCVEVGEVLEAEPPRRLLLTLRQPGWPARTRLELELTAAGGEGCELSVLQRGFEHLALSASLTVWEAYRDRWSAALARLAELVGAMGR